MTAAGQGESILERLGRGEILISDGGTGTYLQAHGLEPGRCPELLNVEQPEIVRQMAAEYFAAGSDLVLTNTFGGNRFALDRHGLGERVRELNRAGVELAREAAPEAGYVCGSVGPTGVFLEPLGEVSEEQMGEVFAEQISALAEGGVDAIVVETMTSTDEARLAITAAKQQTDGPVMATMAFSRGPRGYFTVMGHSPEDAAEALSAAGADVVGANCGEGSEDMIAIAKRMREACERPLLVHANAGIPRIEGDTVVYPETPELMAPRFKELVESGVSIVGGCCGTTPRHVAACVRLLRGSP